MICAMAREIPPLPAPVNKIVKIIFIVVQILNNFMSHEIDN